MTIKRIDVRTGAETTADFTPDELADIAARKAAFEAAEADRVVKEEDLDELPLMIKAFGLALINLGVVSRSDLRAAFRAAIRQLR